MKVDLDYIKEHAPSIVTPLILTNLEERNFKVQDVEHVTSGDLLITVR